MTGRVPDAPAPSAAPAAPRPPAGAAELDRALTRAREDQKRSYWEAQVAAAENKTVLLVEGDDDRDVLEVFLKRRAPTFETRVRVVPAGGRDPARDRLKTSFPHAFALIDRDTWTDAEVAAIRQEEPRLYVTAGWCLENAFFSPEALRHLPPAVAVQIAGAREAWVRAGALWWTLQRTREAQQRWHQALGWTYGSLRADLVLDSAETLTISLEQKVPAGVRDGARFDVGSVAGAFARRCDEVLAWPEAEQWRLGVHGKRALVDLLVPALHSTPKDTRLDLAEQIERPSPLDEIMALLVL